MKTTKNKPKNKAELDRKALDVFLNAVDLSGGISYRSRYGRNIKEIQEQLSKDVDNTAIALLRADVSHLAVIKRAVLAFLLNNPETIVTAEGVNKLLTSDYVRISNTLRQTLVTLRTFESSRKGKGKNDELSEILFDEDEE